jgi:hypothetical protein
VFVLIGATAAAFVVTERLKLEPSPVTKVFVTKLFSPTCACAHRVARVAFRLRHANRVTVAVVDEQRRLVATILGPVGRRRGRVVAVWDGRDQDGAVVPDGTYRPRIHLRHRTILMPNPIHVDTTPPTLSHVHVSPRVLGPRTALRVRYRVSEPARISVFLSGRRIVLGRSTKTSWKVEWRPHGRPGHYLVTASARDVAGNRSARTRPLQVLIPLRVLAKRVRVRPNGRVGVRLETDGRAYFWRLGRRGAFASGRTLVVRAPKKPGTYTLVIRQDKVPHRVTVVVRKKRK